MQIAPRDGVAGAALALGLVLEALLFAALLGGDEASSIAAGRATALWLLAHAFASVIAAGASSALLSRYVTARPRPLFAFCLVLGLTLPLVGALGTVAALALGLRAARERHREAPYWRFTATPSLPFTVPAARRVEPLDGRGLVEQLGAGTDAEVLYRKVLAIGRIRSSLSVEALRAAIAHPDERIRLTAYQTLDRKTSTLNAEIERLEVLAAELHGRDSANAWLQVASSYWELLTLEQNEPVARAQLLERASLAALRAIVADPANRNAHFTLGRVALRQGRPGQAGTAFARATELGMPKETTLPYLAEAAFDNREFERVTDLLGRVDEAFLAYPPLREVAAQWR